MSHSSERHRLLLPPPPTHLAPPLPKPPDNLPAPPHHDLSHHFRQFGITAHPPVFSDQPTEPDPGLVGSALALLHLVTTYRLPKRWMFCIYLAKHIVHRFLICSRDSQAWHLPTSPELRFPTASGPEIAAFEQQAISFFMEDPSRSESNFFYHILC